MAFYSQLDDGSYIIDRGDGSKPLRTAIDPVEYGYEFRPPEEIAGYAPQPLTPEERINRVAEGLDRARRQNDPEYAAFADQQEAQQKADETRQRFEQEGQDLRAERDTRTVAENEVPSGQSVADFQGGGFATARAPLPPEGQPSRNLQRSVPVPTQPVQAPAGQAQDPTRRALSDYAAQNIVKRVAPSRGGWSPTTTTTQREGVPSPEALANVEAAARNTDALGDAAVAARAQSMRDDVIAPQLTALESDMRSLQSSYAERRKVDAEQERLNLSAKEAEKKAAEMPRVNARQDYWADKGTFARMLLAVSAGLFQFSNALTGNNGPNLPLEMVERDIEANAEKLRAQHEDAVAAGKTARNAYSDHLAQYGDPQTAMRALRLEGQALTDRMREIQLAKYGTVEQQQEWQIQKAQRAEQRAREYADISAKAAGSTVSSSRYNPGSPGGLQFDPKMADFYLKLNPGETGDAKGVELRRQSLQDERRVRLPPAVARRVGQVDGFAKDKEQADREGKILEVADTATASLDNMERILERGGYSVLAEDQTDFESQMAILQSQVAQALDLKQMTADERKYIAEPLIGADALTLVTKLGGKERAQVALKRARELFRRKEAQALRNLKNTIGDEATYLVPNVNE